MITTSLVEDAPQSAVATNNQTAQMHRAVLLSQMDEKLRSAPEVIGERDRALFWLYYRQGFTAEEIAGLSATGLTPKGVESALRRVATWLRGEMQGHKPQDQAEPG